MAWVRKMFVLQKKIGIPDDFGLTPLQLETVFFLQIYSNLV